MQNAVNGWRELGDAHVRAVRTALRPHSPPVTHHPAGDVTAHARRRTRIRAMLRIGIILAFAAAVAVVAMTAFPAAMPTVLDALTRNPFAPLLVTVCWLFATASSIIGKRIVSAGHLGWASTATVHIAATVANRVVPAGVGASGTFLLALRQGGASTTHAAGVVTLWAATGALVHAGALVLALAWIRGGWATVAVVALVTAALVAACPVVVRWARAKRAGPARPAADEPRATAPLLIGSERRTYPAGRASPSRGGIRQTLRVRAVRAVTLVRDVLAAARARPARAVAALAAQTGAMLCLMAGFALAVTGFGVPVSATAGMAAYITGSALSAATPTPAGIGSAEAALVGTLVVAGASVGQALPSVLLFRAVILLAPVVAAGLTALAWVPAGWAARRRRCAATP